MTTAPGNVYDKISTENPVERRLVAGFALALESLLPPVVDDLLEVGCGEGHNIRRVADARPDACITGIDIADPDWLAGWHPSPRRVAVSDAAALPFPDRRFDLVLALEVLEHVPSPAAALAEIARVCDGRVIVSVPWEPVWRAGNLVRGRYVASLGNTPGHVQHFTRRGILRLISTHFDVEAVRRPLPWTFVRARARHAY